MIMRHILKVLHRTLKSYHICFKTHNLHVEQEQAGPDQCKIFLLKSSNDTTLTTLTEVSGKLVIPQPKF